MGDRRVELIGLCVLIRFVLNLASHSSSLSLEVSSGIFLFSGLCEVEDGDGDGEEREEEDAAAASVPSV